MDAVTFNHIRRRCGHEVDNQNLTATTDKMFDPTEIKTVEAPADLFMSVSLNLHMEERKDRQIQWLTDDIDHELEKLETIFSESPYEETRLKPISDLVQEKNTPHEKLQNLTAMADWFAEANIDAESYSINVSMEEYKKCENKIKSASQFINEGLAKLNHIHEATVDMVRKFRSFIVSREGLYEEFVDFLSGKLRKISNEDETVEAKSKYGTTEFIQQLKALEVEGFASMEHQIIKWESQLGRQEDIITDHLSTINQLEEELTMLRNRILKVEDNKSQIAGMLLETEELIINAIASLENKDEIITPMHDQFEACAEVIFNMDTTITLPELMIKQEDGTKKDKKIKGTKKTKTKAK